MTTTDPSSSSTEPRPVLIYDGDCAFCVRWVERWRRLTGDAVEYVPNRDAGARFPSIPKAALSESVWLVEPGGRKSEGPRAIFRMLSVAGRRPGWYWAYRRVPGFATVSEATYEFIASHRDLADRLDRRLFPDRSDPRREYAITRTVFLRALACVYLIAFLSLWVQIDGLFGSQGIVPAHGLIQAAKQQLGNLSGVGRFLQFPTLCWWNTSDPFLHFLCIGGIVASVVAIVGLLPLPIFAILWLFYLSLVKVGQPFLGFQWDALLLEAGLLAILISPVSWRLRPGLVLSGGGPRPRPSRIGIFLLRWLTFRLMFLSGLVKWIASDPPAWRDLTAMRYHYETQPLPTWTSWYAYQLPGWFQSFSTGAVLAIELVAPLFFFGPRPARLVACAATVFLQLLIMATGNYGFFNLLALVLCIPLLDDAIWLRVRRGWRRSATTLATTMAMAGQRVTNPAWVPRVARAAILIPATAAILLFTIVAAMIRIDRVDVVPAPLVTAYTRVLPFESLNPYGLFQDMTTRRPEVIIEGSDDGKRWLEYEFKWKPGDVNRRPRFCAPHMPRLDWQMWFAALDLYRTRQADPWLESFLEKLQQGDGAVLALLARNPFPEHPPKYVRVAVYDYYFTTMRQGDRTGAWWARTRIDEPLMVAPAGH